MVDSILATYLIETPHSIERAIEVLAGEGSTGTFVAVPGETAELKERFRTRLHHLSLLDSTNRPSFPQPTPAERYHRAEMTIAIPFEMTDSDLSTVLASIAGNIYEIKEVSALRLIDIEFPPVFAESCPLPRFGVSGTRELTGVENRPLVGYRVKSGTGFTPEDNAVVVQSLLGDVDFIKDDVLLFDQPYCPLEKRVEAAMWVINDHAQKTGKKVMYAFNISGEIDDMMRRHDMVVKAGGNCVQINLNQVGFAGVSYVRRNGELAIHGDCKGWGMYIRQAFYGMDFKAFAKLWRLTGVDHLSTEGWKQPDALSACLNPIFSARDRVLPAVGWKDEQTPADIIVMQEGREL